MQLLFLASAATLKTKSLEVSVEPRDCLWDQSSMLISEMLSRRRSCRCFVFYFLPPDSCCYFGALLPDQGT